MTQKPVTIIILLALLLGIFFFWWPRYQDFSFKLDELREKRQELQTKEEYFESLEKVSSSFQEYSSEISKVKTALPLTAGIPDFLHFIERTAAESGLIFRGTSLAAASRLQPESEVFKIPLTLSLDGPYPAFKNFLLALQKSSRLVEVEQVSFSTPQTGQIFSFDLKIRIHSY